MDWKSSLSWPASWPRRLARTRERRFVPDLAAGRRGLPKLWGRQGFWQIRMRWAVAPLMFAGIVAGRLLGFDFQLWPIAALALVNLAYNVLFARILGRHRDRLRDEPGLDRTFTNVEVMVDYAAMFLLIYFTGGASSPLIVFLIFHVIIAAIHFTAATAYTLAGIAAGGLWLLLWGQAVDWMECHHISFRGSVLHQGPAAGAVMLTFFTATLFITAGLVSRIMDRLRERVGTLAEASSGLARANERFHGLYRMLAAIGAERHMQPVMQTVTAEMARAARVDAVAVKLLSKDRQSLRYVAAHGLPEELIAERIIYLERSPINRRVIAGETVESRLESAREMQLQRELRDLGFRAAMLAPLKVEERVIGTLGFYDRNPGRFGEHNRSFLEIAAELVAIAIDHARAHEAIEALMHERTEFMLETAHNLRAPLAASLSTLDLLTAGYLGDMTEKQNDKLKRLEIRLRALDGTIGELLAIARTRDRSREIEDVVVDLEALARYTEETFTGEAIARDLIFRVERDGDLPLLASGRNLLEQLMENLVSNAIKYTPEGGCVEVRLDRPDPDSVRITVADTGIGIPEREQGKLFREFFRATNARQRTRLGTGLGLVLVKQTVERHAGTLELTSAEGEGTTVVINLPLVRPEPARA